MNGLWNRLRRVAPSALARVRTEPPRPEALARPVPGWLNATLILATGAVVLFFELRRPLRRRDEPKARHDLRNLGVAVLSALTVRALEEPAVAPLARQVHRKGWGLLPRMGLPPWLEVAAAVVLLDYLLYLWHVLAHKVPLLWRFHRVHHADLDLEASTAVRFHFAEMALSVPWRAAQVVVVGAAPRALGAWQTATLVAIIFHHSNIELPERVERWLCRFIMTPRMHGIHHSMVPEETNSNWSTIFSWPDYLHRTTRVGVPQDAIDIGIPEYRDPAELTLPRLVAMPFGRQRPSPALGDRTP
jgi:sterol desaturase/sphingolipid hydroxylase (fatty acid hydroxylase superfamily)